MLCIKSDFVCFHISLQITKCSYEVLMECQNGKVVDKRCIDVGLIVGGRVVCITYSIGQGELP